GQPADGQTRAQTAQAPAAGQNAAEGAAPAKSGDSAEAPRIKGKRYMVRVKNGDAIEERKIVVGVSNRLVAEVRDGLKPGDEVMVDMTQAGQRPAGAPGGPPPAARQPRL
ncbi:MAG TPA: hypothetical protein VEC60_11285, partial [Reyranella sp.]|nr:hypothetical protein [Reyranella sp.]